MNKDIEKFIEDPNNVLKLIDILNNSFTDIYYKYTLEKINALKITIDEKKDLMNKFTTYSANSYYMNGHCPSYFEILHNIFEEYAIQYNSNEHVITKIGNYFYDVNGLVNDKNLNKFHRSEISDLYYIDIMFNNRDELEKFAEKELINIGKEELQYLINKLNSKQK